MLYPPLTTFITDIILMQVTMIPYSNYLQHSPILVCVCVCVDELNPRTLHILVKYYHCVTSPTPNISLSCYLLLPVFLGDWGGGGGREVIETGSHYVTVADFEFTMCSRLASTHVLPVSAFQVLRLQVCTTPCLAESILNLTIRRIFL
jgi:hypothetical protein